MDLVLSCLAWGPMSVCGFISLTLLPSSIVRSPVWVEYRSATGHWSRHFLLLSKGIKVSLSRTESLHYYLINLPRTSDFSFLDWREKLSRVIFSLSVGTGQSCFQTQRACSPAILIRTQPPAPGSAHLLWKSVIPGGKCHILCFCWIKEQRKKSPHKCMNCSVNCGKDILIVGYVSTFLCS